MHMCIHMRMHMHVHNYAHMLLHFHVQMHMHVHVHVHKHCLQGNNNKRDIKRRMHTMRLDRKLKIKMHDSSVAE